jgi:anti-anti-sigma factor
LQEHRLKLIAEKNAGRQIKRMGADIAARLTQVGVQSLPGNKKPDTKDLNSKMTIESTKIDKVVVVKLIGRMDADTNKEFEATVAKLVEEGSIYVVVDLNELLYINSAGLGSFLRNAKRAQEKGGALLLSGIKGLVKEVFEMTRLISVFPVFDSTDAARQSIS